MTLYNILKWILLAYEVGVFIYFFVVVRKIQKATKEFEGIVEEAKAEQEREKDSDTTGINITPISDQEEQIEVIRNGESIVSFNVHPLDDTALRLAVGIDGDAMTMDPEAYHKRIIFLASSKEAKQNLWLSRNGVMAGIDETLTEAEKRAVANWILANSKAWKENAE